jgi:type IV pilus assembly protein PilE
MRKSIRPGHKQMTMRAYMRGVTLMELMIVVVIISILTAIAYPSYRQYVAKAKRNEAKSCLLQIATLQERFYLQNNTYTTDMTNLGFAAAGNNLTDSGTYICNVPVANANTFNAVATYQKADEEAGKCLTFTIDGRAQKGSAPAADCWTNTRL